ncbi:hypothetical protein BD779DRAFT_126923 [Infundibulicybe gibba]|nr:hypothetical protein BD779DRAFT_126923 [Infundibulicybe gibba]
MTHNTFHTFLSSQPRDMATSTEAPHPEIDGNLVISERQPEYAHNSTQQPRGTINYSRRLLPPRPDAPASPPKTPPMMPTASPVPPVQAPPTPKKSSSLKSEMSPMRRKPLIFAAMDDHPSELSTPPPTAWNNNHSMSHHYPTPPSETSRSTTRVGSALSSYTESRFNQSTSSFTTAIGDEPRTSISPPPPIENVSRPISHANYEPQMKLQIEQQIPSNAEPPLPPLPSKKKKSSRSRTTESSSHSRSGSHAGSVDTRHHRTLIKPRPTSPKHVTHLDPPVELDQEVIRNAGLPLDDDPFAKAEVVKVVKPTPRADTPPLAADSPSKKPRTRDGPYSNNGTPSGTPRGSTVDLHGEGANGTTLPVTPNSPEVYHQARARRREKPLEKTPPQLAPDITIKPDRPPEPFPLILFVSDPRLLSSLLSYFSFYDWCILFSVSKQIRTALTETLELREVVLERYLRTVGYSRWAWNGVDPLPLFLQVCAPTPTSRFSITNIFRI